eukprot:350723-Chlamydomonas_euryale.AAC.4
MCSWRTDCRPATRCCLYTTWRGTRRCRWVEVFAAKRSGHDQKLHAAFPRTTATHGAITSLAMTARSEAAW